MIEFTERVERKLRNAQAELVAEAGVGKVMDITNKSKSVVYRWGDADAPDLMSLSEAMRVEGYVRRPVVSLAMVDFLGCEIGFAAKRPGPAARSPKDGRGKVQKVVAARARKAAAPKIRDPNPKALPAPPKAFSLPEPKPFVNFAAYDAGSRRLPLVDLDRHDCRFAVNDAAPGEEHLFCGHAIAPGSAYCPHHTARAFNGVVSEAMRRGDIFRQQRIA